MMIEKACNDKIFDKEGNSYIDLSAAHGTVWLGHCQKNIKNRLQEQVERVWNGGSGAINESARQLLASFFPPGFSCACLYSTGMEAAEFAIRIARVFTGKTKILGFSGSMHGKSMATSALGWENADGISVPYVHRLEIGPGGYGDSLLKKVETCLASEEFSAVFVEPVLASSGGYVLPESFLRGVIERCRHYKTLSVFDEILTGFYRTGKQFAFSGIGEVPDIVLVGKALGNGFPVSAVMIRSPLAIEARMLPGSTYANNALASAVVCATLAEIRTRDMAALVGHIENTVKSTFRRVRRNDVYIRGAGALWVLELKHRLQATEMRKTLLSKGVVVGGADRFIRLTPPATIEPENLQIACGILAGLLN